MTTNNEPQSIITEQEIKDLEAIYDEPAKVLLGIINHIQEVLDSYKEGVTDSANIQQYHGIVTEVHDESQANEEEVQDSLQEIRT